MTEREKAKFDALPEALKPNAEFFLKKELPKLPDKLEQGKWYRNEPGNCVCANGEPYHGCFKLGSENKLAIMFCGGGVSINEYTAARPMSIYNEPGTDGHYFNDVFIIADASAGATGLFKDVEENPFRNWTMLFVPYANGDFHCGTNDFPYTSIDGKKETLHHHGYKNFKNLLEFIVRHIPNPEKILVTGYSAGGFATALLTDDIMDAFPLCNDATCAVDSALLVYDGWQSVAKEVWKTPKKIYERLTGNNLTLDSLKALRDKRGEKVKIMFISSTRDSALVEVQNYLDNGKFIATVEGGNKYEVTLGDMCRDLAKTVGDVGLFLFDAPEEFAYLDFKLTQHCILNSAHLFTIKTDGKNAVEWLFDGANGKLEKLGMNLLQK